jgi:hypothetical protein
VCGVYFKGSSLIFLLNIMIRSSPVCSRKKKFNRVPTDLYSCNGLLLLW